MGRSYVAISRLTVAGVAVLASLLALSGCVAQTPTPSTSATASPTPGATDAPNAPDPEMKPGGTALQNLPYFDFVNNKLLATNAAPDGRTIIDNLVAAGFTKPTMELTPDRTAVDLAADSIMFSVKIGDNCLIGQMGRVGYPSLTAKPIGTGACLVGKTRPIDW
jgi:hypothetical protein